MDDEARRRLLSNVDAHGRPRDKPATLRDLAGQRYERPPSPGQMVARPSPPLARAQGARGADASGAAAEVRDATSASWSTALVALGFLAAALAVRWFFLYRVTDPTVLIPSWSNDTWHRWQIAFLSKEIGFSHGFLTLWDLKGMEYYWGILHPILVAALFALTGSIDVMILRWLTMIFGAVNIALLYLVGRKYWNAQVGIAAAILGALHPIVIFNDPSGMVEPLSFALLLGGIYLHPRRPALTGILWALAALTRAEAWLFSAGLVLAAMLGKEKSEQKLALGLGWGVPVLAYVKYLLDKTGNAIYPIYWNFLANAAGRWEFRLGFTDYQLAARPILASVFAVCTFVCLFALWKRPRAYLLYLLGFGTTAFVCGFIGLTAYLKSYEPWFWMTRFFVFPYLFAGLVCAALLLGWLPGRLRGGLAWGIGWLGVLALLVGVQAAWPAVLFDLDTGYTSRTSAAALRDQGEFVGRAYTEGTVLIPEGAPQITYALARYGGIRGSDILGQMYGPIYYYTGPDPIADWANVGPQMWDWFERENVTLLVMSPDDTRFLMMLVEHPERFSLVGTVPHGSLLLYRVSLVP